MSTAATPDTREHISQVVVDPIDRGGELLFAGGGGSEGRRGSEGHEPTREAAMAAFAKSWRRE